MNAATTTNASLVDRMRELLSAAECDATLTSSADPSQRPASLTCRQLTCRQLTCRRLSTEQNWLCLSRPKHPFEISLRGFPRVTQRENHRHERHRRPASDREDCVRPAVGEL